MLSYVEGAFSKARAGRVRQEKRIESRVVIVLMLFMTGLFNAPLTLAEPAQAKALSATAKINGIRIGRSSNSTRLVFDVSAAVKHKLSLQENPLRLLIDIERVAMGTALPQLKLANTPISAINNTPLGKNGLRFTLALREKIKPTSFVLPGDGQRGHRLVVDLQDLQDLVGRPIKAKKPVARVIKKIKPRDVIIAIDAGHGGQDPGALGPKKLREKNVVMAISRMMQSLVNKEPGFRAVMIRDGDYFLPLRERTKRAHKHRADMFVSIHADAFNKPSANGASVYALSMRSASSETARYLAKRENRADLIGGLGSVSLNDKDKVLAGVLLDLSMTATLESSISVGGEVLKSLKGVARLHKESVEQAGFVVLKSPDIPSILVETGFISNPKEARRLGQVWYQKKIATAIFSGVKRYFQRKPPQGTFLAENRRATGLVHVIARGDTLSDIARRYRVSVAGIRRYNSLKSTHIRIGQRIKIPVSS